MKDSKIYSAILGMIIPFSFSANASIYHTQSLLGGDGTNGCIWSANCTEETWGIDLNGNTGYRWNISSSDSRTKEIYLKLSALSSTRKMSLWINGQQASTISINATDAPRPEGQEVGPFEANLVTGNNVIELRDTEDSMEFDVHYLRLENDEPELTVNSLSNTYHLGDSIILNASVSEAGAWTYQWNLIQGPDYQKETFNVSSVKDMSRCENKPYGQKISGFVTPEVSGFYRFKVSSSGISELTGTYIGVPPALNLGGTPQPVELMEFDQYPEQSGAAPWLEAGQPFYIEFLSYDQTGPGHFAIAWALQDGREFELIPSNVMSEWTREVIPDTVFNSLSDLRNSNQFSVESSLLVNTETTQNTLSFTPQKTGKYVFEVSANKEGVKTKTEIVTLFVETSINDNFNNVARDNGYDGWRYYGNWERPESRDPACTNGNGACLRIDSNANTDISDATGHWYKKVHLEPFTAYRLEFDIRADLANFEMPDGLPESDSFSNLRAAQINYESALSNPLSPEIPLWSVRSSTGGLAVGPAVSLTFHPYTKSGADWNRSGLPIATTNDQNSANFGTIDTINGIKDPSDWSTKSIDFVTNQHGEFYIELRMNTALGSVWFDNIELERIQDITKFNSENYTLNVYNDSIAMMGGDEVMQGITDRLSDMAEFYADFTANEDILACANISAWAPQNWLSANANTNPISYETQLYDIMAPLNAGFQNNETLGVLSHETLHYFQQGLSMFGSHLPYHLEHAYLSTFDHRILESAHADCSVNGEFGTSYRMATAGEYKQHQACIFEQGTLISDPVKANANLIESLFLNILDFVDSENGSWSTVREVQREINNPFSTPWPTNQFDQYCRWWEELATKSSSSNKWFDANIHSEAEKTAIRNAFGVSPTTNCKLTSQM